MTVRGGVATALGGTTYSMTDLFSISGPDVRPARL